MRAHRRFLARLAFSATSDNGMSAALVAGLRACRGIAGMRAARSVGAAQQPACIRAGARLMSSGKAAVPLEPRKLSMDEVVSFCKRRGFIFPGSELYGSIGTGFDYGPLGAQLKKNIQDAWWKDFVERRPDCVGLESALIMNPRGAWGARACAGTCVVQPTSALLLPPPPPPLAVWEASGHVSLFVDPLTECKSCRKRVRCVRCSLGVARPFAHRRPVAVHTHARALCLVQSRQAPKDVCGERDRKSPKGCRQAFESCRLLRWQCWCCDSIRGGRNAAATGAACPA